MSDISKDELAIKLRDAERELERVGDAMGYGQPYADQLAKVRALRRWHAAAIELEAAEHGASRVGAMPEVVVVGATPTAELDEEDTVR